jgi:hypothetical protein
VIDVLLLLLVLLLPSYVAAFALGCSACAADFVNWDCLPQHTTAAINTPFAALAQSCGFVFTHLAASY